MEIYLTKHFSLQELTKTSHKEINNTPSVEIIENLQVLANALEVIRSLLGHPLIISSGYRSPELNKAIGGSANSRHMLGLAADFTCPAFGSPKAICHAIVDAGLPFDQLIYEKTWIHFGLPEKGHDRRGQVLTLVAPGKYEQGIV